MEDDLKPSAISRELRVVPQNVYGWLWSGLLSGKQDPSTGSWTVSRQALEAFKKQRKSRKPKFTRNLGPAAK
jgi:hypothetical protein